MAIGKSGYFDLTGSNTSFTLRVNWSETYEITTNKSVVTIDSVQIKSTGWSGFTYYPDGKINVNGETVIEMSSAGGTHSVRVDSLNEWYTILSDSGTISGNITVMHDNDGSKSVSIEVTGNAYAECRFYTAEGGTSGGNGWYVKGEKIVALTNIPRASTIGASDANIGSKSTIVVAQKSTAYTHSIAYKFGNLTGYVTAAGGISSTEVKYSTTSISWTIPTTFYAQIPNAKTGTCTLTIKTYSGSTQIGDAQTDTFTVTAAQSACTPSVSGSVVDSNATTKALTGDKSKLVRYYSTALCTITATAKNSSTISTKKIGGTTVSGTTRSISKVEVDSISFYAKDSRGYEASTNVEFALVPYVILTNNVSGQRTDPTSGNAKLTIKGDYFNGSFGAVSNSLNIKYRFREVGGTYGSYTTVAPTISGNSYTCTESLSGLDYEHFYEFEVIVSDKLDSVTKTVPIKKGIPVCDWGKSDFSFHVPVKMNGNRINGFIDMGTYEGSINNISNTGLKLNSVVWVTPNTTYLPLSGTDIYGICETWSVSGAIWLQRISYASGSVCHRIYFNSAWQSWVWDNPPMIVGVEYRTADRMNGKPVYTQAIDFGALPNNATKKVEHAIADISSVIDYSLFSYSGGTANLVSHGNVTSILATATYIQVTTNYNLSGMSARAVLRYTKTT